MGLAFRGSDFYQVLRASGGGSRRMGHLPNGDGPLPYWYGVVCSWVSWV